MQVDVDVTPVIKKNPGDDDKEMLSVGVTEDGRTLVRINSSSLSVLQECMRKSDYVLNRKLRSANQSPALVFGTAVHKALETFYIGKPEERIMPVNFRKNADLMAYTKTDLEYENLLYHSIQTFINAAQSLSFLPDDNKRSIATGVWILTHYLEKYLNDPFVVMYDDEGPMVERRVEFPLYEDGKLVIRGFGFIDVILKNRTNNQILITDHKTTSMLGNQFYNRLRPNFQYTFYVWGARECFGIESDSFLVNALQVKARPKTARGTPPQFARQITRRDQQDFDELRKATVFYVKQYLDCTKGKQWPMSCPNPCSMYGGCQYLDICSLPDGLKENVIRAKYQGVK